MSSLSKAPEPLNRPKLAQFLWERDLNFAAAGRALNRTREWVRLICLPFDDPRRRIPTEEDMRLIYDWSKGVVTPADYYPADLQREVQPAAAGPRP